MTSFSVPKLLDNVTRLQGKFLIRGSHNEKKYLGAGLSDWANAECRWSGSCPDQTFGEVTFGATNNCVVRGE